MKLMNILKRKFEVPPFCAPHTTTVLSSTYWFGSVVQSPTRTGKTLLETLFNEEHLCLFSKEYVENNGGE